MRRVAILVGFVLLLAAGVFAVTVSQGGKRLTAARQQLLPSGSGGNFTEIAVNMVRQVRVEATNEEALGIGDVGTVITVMNGGASSTSAVEILQEGVDYSVAHNDVTPIGDHSGEDWVVTYRP